MNNKIFKSCSNTLTGTVYIMNVYQLGTISVSMKHVWVGFERPQRIKDFFYWWETFLFWIKNFLHDEDTCTRVAFEGLPWQHLFALEVWVWPPPTSVWTDWASCLKPTSELSSQHAVAIASWALHTVTHVNQSGPRPIKTVLNTFETSIVCKRFKKDQLIEA